jgi:hypothetical protein
MTSTQLDSAYGTLEIRGLLPMEMAAQLLDYVQELHSMVCQLADSLEYAASYKGDYLVEKHGDLGLVAEARVLIGIQNAAEGGT